MRRLMMGLVVVTLLISYLYKVEAETTSTLTNMVGALGLLTLGLFGAMLFSRLQSTTGTKELRAALKSLEPQCLLTDWAGSDRKRPDYLVVGPGGIAAVCVDDVPAYGRRLAESRIARARERARAAAAWVQERLAGEPSTAKLPAPEQLKSLQVKPILVLTRRQASPDDAGDGVPVLNADRLAEQVRLLWPQPLLDESARVAVTRALRKLGA